MKPETFKNGGMLGYIMGHSWGSLLGTGIGSGPSPPSKPWKPEGCLHSAYYGAIWVNNSIDWGSYIAMSQKGEKWYEIIDSWETAGSTTGWRCFRSATIQDFKGDEVWLLTWHYQAAELYKTWGSAIWLHQLKLGSLTNKYQQWLWWDLRLPPVAVVQTSSCFPMVKSLMVHGQIPMAFHPSNLPVPQPIPSGND